MGHVSIKAVSPLKIPRKVASQLRGCFKHGPALPAYQVKVVAVLGQVIRRSPVVNVTVVDQTSLGKRLEIAVHRGGRQRGLAVGRQRGP